MKPRPVVSALEAIGPNGELTLKEYKGAEKLKGKKALITGGEWVASYHFFLMKIQIVIKS